MKYIKLLDPKSIICPKEEIGNDFYAPSDIELLGNWSLKWSQGIFNAPQYIKVNEIVKTGTFDIAEEMICPTKI